MWDWDAVLFFSTSEFISKNGSKPSVHWHEQQCSDCVGEEGEEWKGGEVEEDKWWLKK